MVGSHWTAEQIVQRVLPLVVESLRLLAERSRADQAPGEQAGELLACAARLSALKRFNDNDSEAVLGAVVSAITEFEREQSRERSGAAAGPEELAVGLVRVAYNRMQRQRRRGKRLQSQVARGTGRDGQNLLEQFAAEEISEFPAQLREVVDSVLQGLPESERQAMGYRFDGLTQQETAQRLGLHRAAVQRIEARFRDTVRRLYERDGDPA
jgi:RNA polymerase sigma factor (sigma-70 family)